MNEKRGNRRRPLSHFWSPNYWYMWLLVGFVRLSCLLPYRTQLRLFKSIGRLAHRFDTRRRATARRNVELCFPELSPDERDALVLAHFESLGASMMELGLARWVPKDKIIAMSRVEGAEHLTDAMKQGEPVLLLTGHFTAMELTVPLMPDTDTPYYVVFQQHPNKFLIEFLRTTREGVAKDTIESSDVRRMVRCLRSNAVVWFAPDQTVRSKQAVLLPFFGEPAMTNTAASKLATLGNAIAIPYFVRRLPEGGYVLTFLPRMENFPSDDPVEDTRRYLGILEEAIRRSPEQYMWTYRKFKGRPESLPDAYANLDALK
ncbi:MAG: lipid A biosynthesis lauroyl acyltransferase [Woeseiaceae bacterium]